MDISTKGIQELKAIGYDLVSQISNAQNNLQIVQAQIKKLETEAAKEETAEQA